MYTPAEERSALLVRKLWKHQLMAFCACVSRILMHHPTRNTSKPTWINAVTFSVPLWIHLCDGVLGNEAKAQQSYNTLQEVSPRNQKKVLFRNFNFMKLRMRIAIVRATHLCMHPRISRIPTSMSRMSQHPQWVDGAGLGLLYHWTNNKSYLKLEERFQEENIECTTI